MLLKYLDDQEQWADILSSVLFAYRTSKHASTGFSPFFLLYGRQPRLPVDLMMDTQPKDTSIEEKCGEIPVKDVCINVAKMQDERCETSKIAMDNITNAQERQKRNYNKRCNPANFKDGDEVLLAVVKNKNRCGGKFDERYAGPYKIVNAVSKGVYRLQRGGKELKKSVNGSRLKPYHRKQNEVSCVKMADVENHVTESAVNQTHAIPGFQSVSQEDQSNILKHRYWLTDIEINAQALLRHQNPGTRGLQDTCLSSTNQFVSETGEFVQIYNANKSHWILLSTIGCRKNEIYVYDSFYRYLHADPGDAIVRLSDCKSETINVIMPAIQRQTNGSSCGLFAVAFETSLLICYCTWVIAHDQQKMRQHLKDCFENKILTEFPQCAKVPFMMETMFTIPQ